MNWLLLIVNGGILAQLAAAHPPIKTFVPTSNMNGEYLISNPNDASGHSFSTSYPSYPDVEYFDAYSPPISTRYGDVYWTMMQPVPLDNNLVARFRDKTMAIVGYEADQVMKTAAGDKSVPITWAYDHHYEAYLSGSYSEMVQMDSNSLGALPFGGMNHGAPTSWMTLPRTDTQDPRATSHVPTSQFFSEGNGGEFRKSFHGYPPGMAQLIDSPTTFHIQPMQIDTRNRNYNGTDFKPDILPRASAAPPNAIYSGLLECPCTTRIHKDIEVTYATQNTGKCETPVNHPTNCFDAAKKVDPTISNVRQEVVDSEDYPQGCSMVHYKNGSVEVVFNKHTSGSECGVGGNHWLGSSNSSSTEVALQIYLDSEIDVDGKATVNITGPDGKWFAVGLGANTFTMSDTPYAIVVDGTGGVTERKLGNHDGGKVLDTSIQVMSNRAFNGRRNVILTRTYKGKTSDYYTFDPKSTSSIPHITASGNGPNFSYHGPKTRGGATLHVVAIDTPTCICNTGIKGSINGIPFRKNCLEEPYADLVQQKNPTCWVDTYQGGLSCCHHKNVLLDADQDQPQEVMTYHLKFRFYFQPYQPETPSSPASHKNLIRLYHQTEANAGEYDVPKADPSTPPEATIHEITARWQVKDMIQKCDTRKSPSCSGNVTDFDGVNLIYAGGHCHAPSCISMELFNADTGKLLCHHSPVYGESNKIFDELGYVAIPPCLWGAKEEGLIPPTFLAFDTNLTSIKRNNNTYAHLGEMASWQMRGILVKTEK